METGFMLGTVELLLILFVLLPLVLVIVLFIVSARRRARPAQSAPTAIGPPPPSVDQRTASLERSRSRYAEERSRILGMLEGGTITPEEADRLFTTLDRETSTMACPYCGGNVRIEAIRCKHCKRDLVEGVDQPRRLLRSPHRVLAGVCGGLAEYTGIDPTLLRLLVAVIVFLSGILTGLVVYLVAALIIPNAK
jgi:phage shock protein C